MADEQNSFPGSGRPSEPPKHNGFGNEKYEPTPPQDKPGGESHPGGGTKKFCSNCGKDWPIDTKFCTACGTWFGAGMEDEKRSYKDHIEQQIQERQTALVPTFAQDEPKPVKRKGRSPVVNAIIILLCIIIIGIGVAFTFFRGALYTFIGDFSAKRGQYNAAAGWYNTARSYLSSGPAFDKTTRKMEDASLKLYGDYLDLMQFKGFTADFELKIGDRTFKGKIYQNASGQRRIETTDSAGKLVSLVIFTDNRRYTYEGSPNPAIRDLPDEFKNSRLKKNRTKTLETLGESGLWYIEDKTRRIDGKSCYLVKGRFDGGKLDPFLFSIGFMPDDRGFSGVKALGFYIGVEKKLLHRLTVEGEAVDPLAIFNFSNIKPGASIPDEAFTVPVRKWQLGNTD